jgi:hypothetical protein
VKGEGKRTEYVVLRQTGIGETPRGWMEQGRVAATSAKAAIAQAVGETSGTYTAVPARSFQPVTVSVEQKATLKFSEQKPEPST